MARQLWRLLGHTHQLVVRFESRSPLRAEIDLPAAKLHVPKATGFSEKRFGMMGHEDLRLLLLKPRSFFQGRNTFSGSTSLTDFSDKARQSPIALT